MAFNAQDFVTPYITMEEVLEIKRAFDLFDGDLGGEIEPIGACPNVELKRAIESLGLNAKAQAVYQMIEKIDVDGSGKIDFGEFFTMMTARPSENESREEIDNVFMTFDNEKNGTCFEVDVITLKDLRRVAKELGELTDDSVLEEMIAQASSDGNMRVTKEDFYNLMTKRVH